MGLGQTVKFRKVIQNLVQEVLVGMKKGFLFGGERDAKKPQPHKKATPDPVEKGPKADKNPRYTTN